LEKKIKNNIYWVGKVDWELRQFHGSEFSTHKGSTYNSYLIREGKTALIDTVWAPYAKEYVRELEKVIDLKKIDYIIANHGEVDHSGALGALLHRIPDTPVYCTAAGVKSLKGQYHADWNFQVVKTGDRLSLGSKELVFIEAPMLHWPDSMFSYLTGDAVLFSNDAFGQHYATEALFNDLVDQCELYSEAMKYYANILNPFNQMVAKKIDEVLALNLPLDMICTSHGVIWRDNPVQIVHKYLEWAKNYRENQITIIYDTMWNSTRTMAEAIAEGVMESGGINLKLYNASITDKNDLITEIFKSKLVVLGSPTVNRGIMSSLAGLMEEVRGLGFKGKKAAAFGAYGWSGESVKTLEGLLKNAGFEIYDEGLRLMWNPDGDAREKCREFGRKLAAVSAS